MVWFQSTFTLFPFCQKKGQDCRRVGLQHQGPGPAPAGQAPRASVCGAQGVHSPLPGRSAGLPRETLRAWEAWLHSACGPQRHHPFAGEKQVQGAGQASLRGLLRLSPRVQCWVRTAPPTSRSAASNVRAERLVASVVTAHGLHTQRWLGGGQGLIHCLPQKQSPPHLPLP